MGPIESITSVLRNYGNFNGWAQRSEFWWFSLAWILLYGLIYALFAVPMDVDEGIYSENTWAITGFVLFLVWLILAIALILPSLAVTCRRLHDTGKSGWFQLLNLVPFPFGAILVYILCAMPGTRGPNQYGPDPLQAHEGEGAGVYGASPAMQSHQVSPGHAETGGRRFCSQCGTQLQPGARFCSGCGTAVNSGA